MHSGRITDATRTLGPPVDWDKYQDGVCTSLVIRDEPTTAGMAMTSAWFPTPEEIARIAAGAPVYLTVVGQVHPPVCMKVGTVPSNG